MNNHSIFCFVEYFVYLNGKSFEYLYYGKYE